MTASEYTVPSTAWDGAEGEAHTRYVSMYTCLCADWQWNGEASGVSISNAAYTYAGETRTVHERITESGRMAHSLRENDFVREYTIDRQHTPSKRFFEPTGAETSVTVQTYQGGALVATDGAPDSSEDTIYGLSGGMGGTLEAWRDGLYW